MRSAFSLVELSIVLVILGLLTGGILTGQNLIRAAELRRIPTEYSNYQTAALTFRDKYFYLPGDMPNATDFWGAAAAGASCGVTASTTTATCSGDGDGVIDTWTGSSSESLHFWKHLTNAGLIEGSYTGDASSGGLLPGENTPLSKLANAGWAIGSRNYSSHADFYDIVSNAIIQLGAPMGGGDMFGPVLTPEEAWNIDTKMDDGKPGTGKIWAIHWDDCGGASASDEYDTDYALSTTSIECALLFEPGY